MTRFVRFGRFSASCPLSRSAGEGWGEGNGHISTDGGHASTRPHAVVPAKAGTQADAAGAAETVMSGTASASLPINSLTYLPI